MKPGWQVQGRRKIKSLPKVEKTKGGGNTILRKTK
jgi:hypothetical protein